MWVKKKKGKTLRHEKSALLGRLVSITSHEKSNLGMQQPLVDLPDDMLANEEGPSDSEEGEIELVQNDDPDLNQGISLQILEPEDISLAREESKGKKLKHHQLQKQNSEIRLGSNEILAGKTIEEYAATTITGTEDGNPLSQTDSEMA